MVIILFSDFLAFSRDACVVFVICAHVDQLRARLQLTSEVSCVHKPGDRAPWQLGGGWGRRPPVTRGPGPWGQSQDGLGRDWPSPVNEGLARRVHDPIPRTFAFMCSFVRWVCVPLESVLEKSRWSPGGRC